jgi:MFS family permease
MISAIFYLGIGMTALPRTMLINQQIAGDSRHPNAQSSFVDSTCVLLSTVTTIFFSKYFSAMGDHIGRRPILIVSTVFSLLSTAMWLISSSATGFYVASLAAGIANIFFFVAIAWLCDHAIHQAERGKAIALYVGTVIGLTLSIGFSISPTPLS